MNDPRQTMVDVRGLRKVYGDKAAIDDVTFQIHEGEIVGILGLNGAGKSTVLKILGAMLLPTAGEARVGGHSIEDAPHEVRKLIGYLPDQAPLYDEMAVRPYLEYVAGLKGLSAREARNAAGSAMARTNLDAVASTPLGALSHGFRQRAGIAQAIVHSPRVVILDEPINGLDPLQIVEMRDLINSLHGDHTVILSSHILSEITRTCDRILIIDKGRVTAQGSEQDLRERIQSRQTVQVELADGDDHSIARLATRLGQIGSTTRVEVSGRMITLQTADENRPAIARAVVDSGMGLAGLTRQDDGLEALFMRLVSNGAVDSEKSQGADHGNP